LSRYDVIGLTWLLPFAASRISRRGSLRSLRAA
jgi:hypothetical protein